MIILCLVLFSVIGGCTKKFGPPGWRSLPEQSEKEAFGSWIEVNYQLNFAIGDACGELIAIEPEKLFILTDTGLVTISRSNINRLQVSYYSPHTGGIVAWTVIGAFSTLSHGIVLIVSAPLWLIVGGATSAAHSAAAVESIQYFREENWLELSKHARFPQGFPENLNPDKLMPKKQLLE
jgi:hypothetical protein